MIRRLWGIGVDGARVPATRGTYFPIDKISNTVKAGDRVEFVVDTERLVDCESARSRLVDGIEYELTTGRLERISLGERMEAGCRLAFGDAGAWD
jgi:hypothetical protein